MKMPEFLRRSYYPYVVTILAVAVLTAVLIPVRDTLGPVNIVLLFLLCVVAIATRWGWGPGLFASAIANLAYNFFFVPPLHTFTVQEPRNVLGLIVFLVVASVTSALLARARAGEADARRREGETAILYDLSRLIIVQPNTAATLTTICDRVRTTFGVESCAVLTRQGRDLLPAAWSGRFEAAPSTAYERRSAEDAFETSEVVFLNDPRGRRRPRIVGNAGRRDRKAPVVFVPLRVTGSVIGVLQVVGGMEAQVFTQNEIRLLEAFADEAALAVDRDRLLREASQVQALQETDLLKSALLSAVSHDLRTPLASIKASVSSLLQEDISWDEGSRREFLSAIDEETDRLTRLVGNLLDLSRIEGGALHPEKDWYDITELLETVVARMERTLSGHHLELTVADDVGEVALDYVHVSQVVTNLIENASHAAPEGTTIELIARRRGSEVEIIVEDEGPGIPEEERQRIFDKFYRLVSAGQRGSGSGLGLAISKGFVEAHGGTIRAEAAPGGGARFVVTLPAPAAPVALWPPAVVEAP
jgi:two-component system sensor histidine kinase KdpD